MDDFFALKKIKEGQKKEQERTYKENSKKRLLANLERKFKTTMIGSLDAMEKSFGYLWGHGKRYAELSDNQKDFRQTWNELRSAILDLGHANLRAAQNEIAQYTLTWDKYVTELPFLQENAKNATAKRST